MNPLQIALALLCISSVCWGQKQGNFWYFGNHAGLDFSSGVPVAIGNGRTHHIDSIEKHSEGTAAIADALGNLLFYTNGQTIWNSDHEPMQNGDSLLGSASSTQSALIVPQPGSEDIFYVFTTDAFYGNELKNGFRYSVVDICENDGKGAVMVGRKNILLLDTVAEKLTAVRHNNGVDYWIITHKYQSDAFYAYLLTSAGISQTTISRIGSVHKHYYSASSTAASLGQLKASPDGSKLVCVNGNGGKNISELFSFNRTTGAVLNCIDLKTDSVAIGLYGASFSPDNSKLYISSWINNNRIYQYDLSAGDAADIVNSKTVVAQSNVGPWFMAMQLGPDGKLYIAQRNQTYLSVINNPNELGSDCNFEMAAVSLNGRMCSYGLPNFIDFYDYSNFRPSCFPPLDIAREISFSPNPFSTQIAIQSNLKFDNANLIVYNVLGQELINIKNINTQNIVVQRGNLAAATYLFVITEANKRIWVEKVVVE